MISRNNKYLSMNKNIMRQRNHIFHSFIFYLFFIFLYLFFIYLFLTFMFVFHLLISHFCICFASHYKFQHYFCFSTNSSWFNLISQSESYQIIINEAIIFTNLVLKTESDSWDALMSAWITRASSMWYYIVINIDTNTVLMIIFTKTRDKHISS